MPYNAWAFESVPVPNPSVHLPGSFKPLPIRPSPQDDVAVARQLGHRIHLPDHQCRPGTGSGGSIQEIAGIKHVPLSVDVLKGMRINRKRSA